MASSKRDELIAETLGDVLKLHDMVKALPEELRASLAPSLGAIAKAAKEGQTAIDNYAKGQESKVGTFAAAELERMRKEFQTITKDSFAAVARDLQASTSAHYRLVQEASGQGWRTWLLFFGGAIMAGIAAGLTVWVMKSEPQRSDEYLALAYGRAYLSIGANMDKRAQKQMQDAVAQQEAEMRERLIPKMPH